MISAVGTGNGSEFGLLSRSVVVGREFFSGDFIYFSCKRSGSGKATQVLISGVGTGNGCKFGFLSSGEVVGREFFARDLVYFGVQGCLRSRADGLVGISRIVDLIDAQARLQRCDAPHSGTSFGHWECALDIFCIYSIGIVGKRNCLQS